MKCWKCFRFVVSFGWKFVLFSLFQPFWNPEVHLQFFTFVSSLRKWEIDAGYFCTGFHTRKLSRKTKKFTNSNLTKIDHQLLWKINYDTRFSKHQKSIPVLILACDFKTFAIIPKVTAESEDARMHTWGWHYRQNCSGIRIPKCLAFLLALNFTHPYGCQY